MAAIFAPENRGRVEAALNDELARFVREGITQAELGIICGVSRQSIVSVEGGDYAPSVYLALRLARALDTTVGTLFGDQGESSS